MIELIDYKWFYSATSQSLAALVGIVGVFIVYRLQIQQNNINSAVRTLQEYMSRTSTMKLYYLTESETLDTAKKQLEHRRNSIKNAELHIERLKPDDSDPRRNENQIGHYRERKKRDKQEEKNLLHRLNAIENRKVWRHLLKHNALFTITWLTIVFFLSIMGLLLSTVFLARPYLGDAYAIIIFLFMAGGLYFLIRICEQSLDINIKVKEK